MKNTLQVNNLSVAIDDKQVVSDFNLELQPGSTHALMGPNGSGKSSLAQALIGHPRYEITSGSVQLDGQELTKLTADKRARAGLFLAFQYPQAVPGVAVFTFLRAAYTALTGKEIGVVEFKELLENTLELLGIDQTFAHRFVNEQFSGGEKKQFELLQLVLFKPKVAILDEIDSGLDVDALKKVARGIELAREENPDIALLFITHYARILEHIHPDRVHIMYKSKLKESGGPQLAFSIDRDGYEAYAR